MARKQVAVKPPDVPAQPAPDLPFTLGQWSGLPQWRCTSCAFDTLDGEMAILEHFALRHLPPPPLPSVIPIYNQFGNEVRPK